MKTLLIALSFFASTQSFAQFVLYCGPSTQSVQGRNDKAPFLFFASDLPGHIEESTRLIFQIRGKQIASDGYQLTKHNKNKIQMVSSVVAPWISEYLPSTKYTQLDFDLTSCQFDDHATLKVTALSASKKAIEVPGFGKAILSYICECDFD